MKIMNPRYGGEKDADTGLWIDCEDLRYRIWGDNIQLISQGPYYTKPWKQVQDADTESQSHDQDIK